MSFLLRPEAWTFPKDTWVGALFAYISASFRGQRVAVSFAESCCSYSQAIWGPICEHVIFWTDACTHSVISWEPWNLFYWHLSAGTWGVKVGKWTGHLTWRMEKQDECCWPGLPAGDCMPAVFYSLLRQLNAHILLILRSRYLHRQENAYPQPQLMHMCVHTPLHTQAYMHTHASTLWPLLTYLSVNL